MVRIGQSMHPNYVNGDLSKLDDELKQFVEAGASACELVLQGLDVIIGAKVIESRQDALIKILRKHDLEYTMHMPHSLNLLDTEMLDIYLEIFRASIAFAQAAEIKLLNYHAGKIRERKPEPAGTRRRSRPLADEALANASSVDAAPTDGSVQEQEDKPDPKTLIKNEMEHIRLLAGSAPEILFCMENALFTDDKEFDEFSSAINVSDMISFCQGVNQKNFKLTFDIGHRFLALDGDKHTLLEDMKTLLPFVGHIHLHDNCGNRKDSRDGFGGQRLVIGAGDIHLPLGWGAVPIREAVELLKDYEGIINLEIEQRFSYHYSDAISIVRNYLELT